MLLDTPDDIPQKSKPALGKIQFIFIFKKKRLDPSTAALMLKRTIGSKTLTMRSRSSKICVDRAAPDDGPLSCGG